MLLQKNSASLTHWQNKLECLLALLRPAQRYKAKYMTHDIQYKRNFSIMTPDGKFSYNSGRCLFIVMLTVILMAIIMLNVIMQNAILLDIIMFIFIVLSGSHYV